jgi:hypothetical protein
LGIIAILARLAMAARLRRESLVPNGAAIPTGCPRRLVISGVMSRVVVELEKLLAVSMLRVSPPGRRPIAPDAGQPNPSKLPPKSSVNA